MTAITYSGLATILGGEGWRGSTTFEHIVDMANRDIVYFMLDYLGLQLDVEKQFPIANHRYSITLAVLIGDRFLAMSAMETACERLFQIMAPLVGGSVDRCEPVTLTYDDPDYTINALAIRFDMHNRTEIVIA